MTRPLTAIVLMLAVTAAACGKSAQQKAAEEESKALQQSADKTQQGANEMAKGLQQMAQGLQQLAQGGTKDGKAAPLVDFQKLATVLPAVSGWTRSEPEGHSLTLPVPVSNTEAKYTKGNMEVTVTITDSAFNQIAIAPLTMMTAAGYSEKTSSGYKRATNIGGVPAWEEWDGADKTGTVGAIIGNRFIVDATGSDLDSIDRVKEIVAKIDANKLAALK